MYTISNQQHKEILMLIKTVQVLSAGTDLKSHNTMRRAKVLYKQLIKKQLTNVKLQK